MKAIRLLVPLAELFGYATDLRSRTQGRASHTPMQLQAYHEVPANISKEIVARVRGE
jgi:elongation factor G